MELWKKIFIGMILGIIAGILFKNQVDYILPFGTVFINSLKMLVVPLIFFSLITGVASMEDTRKMGRVSIKMLLIFLFSTVIAVSIGIAVGVLTRPGAGVHLIPSDTPKLQQSPDVIETLVNLIPTNPIDALASGNILQIVIFALIFGISITLAGEAGKPVKVFCESAAEVMYKLTGLVMKFAPYGVFALMAWVTGSFGYGLFISLIKLVFWLYMACILFSIIVYGGLIGGWARLNPLVFFSGVFDAMLLAFTTCSSSGTLPVTMQCAEKNLGISKGISRFILPVGATINMNGTAIYQSICAIFVAQVYGIHLTYGSYVTIILTSTLAAIGTAGVPGSGLVMFNLVLTSVGLPMEGMAIIAGVDRLLNMPRVVINITGDAATALLVAKSEGELDTLVYNAHLTKKIQEKVPFLESE
jgi:Na+/H+-dicarboxylate symporter